MSSSMRNFMEAYGAVHSKEAKEELDSQRDPISEMNTARLQDNDLRDLAEEILEEVFKTSTVKEAEDIIFNMIPESNIVGREEKLDRIYAAFGETFSKIRLKNQAGQLEEFAKYRQKKRLEETWSARFNQDKRVARVHSTVIAEDVAVIKKGLLGLYEKKKGDPCWVGYKQVGMKNKGGKQVPNCVPANEAAQYDEMYKGKHGQSDKEYAASRSQGGKMISGDDKMSGAEYTHGRRVKAANPGMQPDVGGKTKPKSQGKMDKGTKADLMYRKANLKKEEVEQVAEADSLAAMQARREKRLAAQRKREGTTVTGRDFGHDYSLSADQQKARRDAEFKAGMKKEEFDSEQLDEISQKTATRAYAQRATNEYETDSDSKKSDAARGRIERKFGKKAGQHADRAAHALTFGRKSSTMPKKPTNEETKVSTLRQGWADAYKSVYEVDEAAKPDFLDLDKDGDKKESMKKAAHDKKKGMKEELESSGKFSESEILKILASL